MDLGCGDGKLVYRMAGEDPETFFLGVDAARENLQPIASKSSRSLKKGGRGNLVYLILAAECLPGELFQIADLLMINFPWGSLLRSFLTNEDSLHERLCSCLKRGGELVVLLNDSLYADGELVQRLEIPRLDDSHLNDFIVPALDGAGFNILESTLVKNVLLPVRTSWGRKLTQTHQHGASWMLRAVRVD